MEQLTQNLAEYLKKYIVFNTDPESDLHKYRKEFLFPKTGDEAWSDKLIQQFQSINQTNGFELERLMGCIDLLNSTWIDVFTISNKNEEAEVSNAQIYNLNLNSGYNITIGHNGMEVCNIFFNKKFLHTPIAKLSEKETGLFLANLRYACMYIMKFSYPQMDQKFSNIAGAVMAVGVAKEMQIPFTPTLLGHYLEVTPQLAEAIIDKYDAENHCYIGVPWIF